MTSASSDWPLPATAAMPTISPARTSSDAPRSAATPRSLSARDVLDLRARRRRLDRRPLELLDDRPPDHQSGQVRARAPFASIPAAVTLPPRMTVIRSAMVRTSASCG
jgi:hypothetical protein